MGTCGCAFNSRSGFPASRQRLAALFCGDLRSRRAEPRPRVFAAGDGIAESSGGLLRVRPYTQRQRLSMDSGPGTYGGARRRRRGNPASAPAAPPGRAKCPRRYGQHHGHYQDAGQRHKAGRPNATLLRSQRPIARRMGGAFDSSSRYSDFGWRKRRRHDE